MEAPMLNDLRQALRLLVRASGFTATACLTLALGIGANAAIFSVVDAALFRPMPYKDADRLVNVYRIAETVDGQRVDAVIGGALVDVVREVTQVFEGVEVFRTARPTALATGVDQNLWVGGFAPALPEFLGVRPQVGRAFTREDVTAQDAIGLSDGFWQRAFHRDPGVLGKTIAFGDRTHIVVGVMPPTFRHFVGTQTDAWLPIGDHDGSDLAARLRPGLTVAQAQRELNGAIARLPPKRVRLELWIRQADWKRTQTPPPTHVSARAMLVSLMGAVGFVLLIACSNVANLLLTRTFARQREIAVRGALGATRWQLVRQFLVEGVVLAGLGGVVAAAVAWWAIRAIPAIVPANLMPSLFGVSLPQPDLRLLAFGGLVVVVAGLSCGVVPAVRASGSVAIDGLLAGGQRIAGSSRGQRRIRHAFQALQIALAVVLLVGAGLLINSFLRMVNTPTGFDSAHLAYVSFTYPAQSFKRQADRVVFAQELIARLSVVPGVRGVSVGQPPVSGGVDIDQVVPDGDPARAAVVRSHSFFVGPDYFEVAGIALKEGRVFEPEEQQNAPRVIIISENAAGRFWPGRSPVGERIVLSAGGRPYTVVGVVPHLKTVDVAQDGVELFFPAAQFSAPPGLLVRTTGDAGSVAASIRALVQAVDPRVTVQRIGTVDHLFAESDPLGSSRFYAVLLGGLAVLGLLTAAMGVYGLLAFAVGQRTREIGVRIALGAEPASVRRLVISDAIGPVALGTAAGLIAATWLSKFLASHLFHVSPHDLTTFGAIISLLVIVCALSVVVPVRRATHIDPVDALRIE
jgi:putative ABC transport system permease protein